MEHSGRLGFGMNAGLMLFFPLCFDNRDNMEPYMAFSSFNGETSAAVALQRKT